MCPPRGPPSPVRPFVAAGPRMRQARASPRERREIARSRLVFSEAGRSLGYYKGPSPSPRGSLSIFRFGAGFQRRASPFALARGRRRRPSERVFRTPQPRNARAAPEEIPAAFDARFVFNIAQGRSGRRLLFRSPGLLQRSSSIFAVVRLWNYGAEWRIDGVRALAASMRLEILF